SRVPGSSSGSSGSLRRTTGCSPARTPNPLRYGNGASDRGHRIHRLLDEHQQDTRKPMEPGPTSPVDPQYRPLDVEERVLAYWQRSDAFNKLRQQRAGQPEFRFLDGPITANNPMGVHHAWGRTLKDAFIRFHAMHNESCRYQNGYDCQGLWVEV